MDENKKKDSLWTLGLKLFLIAAVAAGLLAGVFFFTRDRIKENEEAAIQGKLESIYPGAVFITNRLAAETLYWRAESNGTVIGYVISQNAYGYAADPVEMLIGFDADGTIHDIAVIKQNETPGLGANVVNKALFLSNYINQQALDISFTKADAITGATITSKGVFDGIVEAYNNFSIIVSLPPRATAEDTIGFNKNPHRFKLFDSSTWQIPDASNSSNEYLNQDTNNAAENQNI